MRPDDCIAMHASQLPPGPPCTGYLLIDPCNLDQYSFPEPLPMLHCTPAALTKSDDVMPRLIDVANLTPQQQHGLVDVMALELRGERPPVVCAWIDCALEGDDLARHLSRFLVGPGTDGGDVLWRYYDPRVFALAVSILEKSQLAALLGPACAWWLPWCGRWWRTAGPGVDIAPMKGVLAAWPTNRQWAGLNCAAQVSRVINEMTCPNKKMENVECLRLLREVTALMVTAKARLRLSDNDALVDYALMNLRYGAQFRHHAKLASAWDELTQSHIHWHDLTALLDESDYLAMQEHAVSLSGVA